MWFFIALLAIGLTSCGNQAENILPTLAIAVQPTPSLALESSETPSAPATSTQPAPTATPRPSPTPCQYSLQPDLAEAWDPGLLGCPISAGMAVINTAYAPFEGGQMLWRGDTDTIYVLTHDGHWSTYPNEWRDGDPEFTCGGTDPLTTPIRGFGRVWCDHPDVRETLGAATAEEVGDSASAVQDFGNGTILTTPFGGIFIFVGEDSTWRTLEE